MDAAIDAGINFFDTADIYGGGKSEEFLGRALGARRSKIVLATKFGMKFDEQRTGAKPAYVQQAVEDSLRRLGTDYIDLYQLHQPDASTPIADTLGASERSGEGRQGARDRMLEFLGGAASRGGAAAVTCSGSGPLRQRPESLQHDASRAGSRGSAGVRARRASRSFPISPWPTAC